MIRRHFTWAASTTLPTKHSKFLTHVFTDTTDSWPKDSRVVFTSNDGRRSLDKASYFRAYGLPNAQSLTGGLAPTNAEVGHQPVPLPVGEL